MYRFRIAVNIFTGSIILLGLSLSNAFKVSSRYCCFCEIKKTQQVSGVTLALRKEGEDEKGFDECLSRRGLFSRCASMVTSGFVFGAPHVSFADASEKVLTDRGGSNTLNQDFVEAAVEELYDLVSNSMPSSYSKEQRKRIESLLDTVSEASIGREWKRDLLPGTWRVVYLRPGENGGGLDRRIPFPELPFNESYQLFTSNTITNVGQVLGPALRVEVSGTLQEVDPKDNDIPKQFRADIEGGELCTGLYKNSCLSLPISGVGIFDGIYLDDKLRIGKNLNGSGAIVIQVRVS